jgi:hypothetical protein
MQLFNVKADGAHNKHFDVYLVDLLRNYNSFFNTIYYTDISHRVCSYQTSHNIFVI